MRLAAPGTKVGKDMVHNNDDRPISLNNIDAKVPNKIPASQSPTDEKDHS